MKNQDWVVFSTQLRIVFILTIGYFRRITALCRREGVTRTINFSGFSGMGPGNLSPVNGEFTSLTGISKIAVSFGVAMALFCPAAAFAFSYDEIVQIVQSEEKVFGKGNYELSLDQRLVALENAIFGHAQEGSDSFRLRAICRNLGVEKQPGSVMAAPYLVDVTPASKSKETSKEVVKEAPKAEAPKIESSETTVATETLTEKPVEKIADNPPAETTILSDTVEQSPPVVVDDAPKSKSHLKSKAALQNNKVEETPAVTEATTAPAVPATAAPAAVSSNPITSDASVPQSAQTNPANLIVVLLGGLAIVTGLALFFFLKNKEDAPLPFAHKRYDELEYDEEYDEAEVEPAFVAEDLQAALSAPVEAVAYSEVVAHAKKL